VPPAKLVVFGDADSETSEQSRDDKAQEAHKGKDEDRVRRQIQVHKSVSSHEPVFSVASVVAESELQHTQRGRCPESVTESPSSWILGIQKPVDFHYPQKRGCGKRGKTQ
jgi:hypothetical protein